jgi:hypothetical protein
MPKKLYTSYYGKAGQDPRSVSISGEPPRWIPDIHHCGILAPTWSLVSQYKRAKINQVRFKELYLGLLVRRNADPQVVADSLPEGSILCCYEKTGEFCHRHITAEWLQQADVTIEELK